MSAVRVGSALVNNRSHVQQQLNPVNVVRSRSQYLQSVLKNAIVTMYITRSTKHWSKLFQRCAVWLHQRWYRSVGRRWRAADTGPVSLRVDGQLQLTLHSVQLHLPHNETHGTFSLHPRTGITNTGGQAGRCRVLESTHRHLRSHSSDCLPFSGRRLIQSDPRVNSDRGGEQTVCGFPPQGWQDSPHTAPFPPRQLEAIRCTRHLPQRCRVATHAALRCRRAGRQR